MKYPTWLEWQKNINKYAQAPIKPCQFVNYPEALCTQTSNDPALCAKCRRQRIPYYVAERMGIKPLEEEAK